MAAMLSTQEVAARLGVTPQHVRRLIESGQLAAERVGHRYVVDGDSVTALHAARGATSRIPSDTLARIAQAERMLARFPWDAIREAQRVIATFHEAQQAGTTADAPMTWQEWAGSAHPQDAIAKLQARAQARTRGAAAESATALLRAMREGRHADG
jgi:excisionase family DNA binding protein